MRLELNFARDIQTGLVYTLPSFSLFYRNNWQMFRFYQGITVGLETGIGEICGLTDPFEGRAYFINALVGAELVTAGNCNFFFEIGNGIGIIKKSNAYNGGTVIGGGMRFYL